MKKNRDDRNEGFMTGGIHERRDSGLEGYRKEGMQEGVKQDKRVQERRHAEQERCWTGGIQERWISGQVGCRTGGMQESGCTGKEG